MKISQLVRIIVSQYQVDNVKQGPLYCFSLIVTCARKYSINISEIRF